MKLFRRKGGYETVCWKGDYETVSKDCWKGGYEIVVKDCWKGDYETVSTDFLERWL